MHPETKRLKRAYRRYVKTQFPSLAVGLINRAHCRYMGYAVPVPFRQWAIGERRDAVAQ